MAKRTVSTVRVPFGESFKSAWYSHPWVDARTGRVKARELMTADQREAMDAAYRRLTEDAQLLRVSVRWVSRIG